MKKIIKYLGSIYVRLITKREYNSQKFIRINERSIEYGFVFTSLSEIAPKTILDVGTGRSSFPVLARTCGYLVKAIDNITDYWPRGMTNRHFHIVDDDILNPKESKLYDVLTCISVLEHIDDPDKAVQNMLGLVKKDGYLIISFPFNENKYHHNVYELPDSSYGQKNPFRTQSYSRKELDKWFPKSKCVIEKQEYWRLFTGELWTQGNGISPPIKASKDLDHQLTCLLVRKIGD